MLEKDEALLLRALDRRIVGPIILAYTISYIDRSNMSNSLSSLERSIGLTPSAYALASAMFTLSLVLVEVPSNLLVKRYGSRIWLSCLIGGCGLCTLLQAFCPGWRSLVALRFILGGFEGGVFPGFLYSLTLFYSPKNLTVRISSFTLAASVAFALGSFLAGVILPIRGALDGWQLLFLYQGLATLLIALLLWTVLPSSPAETASFLPPHLHSLLVVSQPGPPDLSAVPSSALLARTPPRSATSSRASSRASSPKPTVARSPHRQPLLQALPALKLPTPIETLISPLTVALSVGYLLLLLATTPSAFLPRLLQQRYALSERDSNLLVGIVYTLGGIVQFGIGWLAGRRGVSRVWRVVATGVVAGWLAVGLWEGVIGRGQGPIGSSRKGVVVWDDDGVGSFLRWVGVATRLAVTMATPTLGSLYLSKTVSIPPSLAPQMGTLTAAVVAFGNIAGALGPTIYASAIPALSAGEPITNLPPTATSAEDGFPLWAELARRDALMGIVVLGSWAIFEGVERWVNRMESTVLRGRGTTLGQRRVSGASPATLGWAEEGGPLLAGEGSDVDDEG